MSSVLSKNDKYRTKLKCNMTFFSINCLLFKKGIPPLTYLYIFFDYSAAFNHKKGLIEFFMKTPFEKQKERKEKNESLECPKHDDY